MLQLVSHTPRVQLRQNASGIRIGVGSWGRWLTFCCGAISLIGCSRQPDPQRFVPPPDVAQRALEAVLKAWQSGEAPGMIAETKPQVHITDAHRKAGQRLEKYQILGEVPGDAPRCFAVKATFSNPKSEERIRFVVIGIDPLWVFRHEDLELLSQWDHKMDPVTDQDKDKANVPDKATQPKTDARSESEDSTTNHTQNK